MFIPFDVNIFVNQFSKFNMYKQKFRSIAAILAGMIIIIVLSIITDLLLENLGIFPPPDKGLFITWMLALALLYRCVYAVIGGYITALLAPIDSMRHVILLGIIGTFLSIIGVIVGWNLSAHWYPIALVITALPCTYLGGKLKKEQNS